MIVTDIGFHPLSKKITLFLGSILLINIVTAHKCFVCGPNNADENVENNGDLIPTCDRFNPNNPTYIRNCLPQSKGCSIQTNATVLTRTCELLAIADCKKANNVEYCYCSTELCNKFHPTREDDEEREFEGSGVELYSTTDVTSVLPGPNIPSSIPTIASSTVTMHRINNIRTLLIILFGFLRGFLCF